MSTGGVEVSECNHAPFGIRVGYVVHDPFTHGFSAAVYGLGVERGALRNGNGLRSTVYGGGRGVNQIVAVVSIHDINKVDGSVDVVLIILDGFLAGFADGLVGSNVDHAPDAAFALVSFKHGFDVFGVGDVAFEEGHIAGILLFLAGIRR